MNGKLLCEIIQRIESVAGVKTFLILAVAALDLAIVTRRVRTDQFMPDTQLGGSFSNSVGKSRLLFENDW